IRDEQKEDAYFHFGLFLVGNVMKTPENAGLVAFEDWFDFFQSNTLMDHYAAEIESRVQFKKPPDPTLERELDRVLKHRSTLGDRYYNNIQQFLGNKPPQVADTHPYSRLFLNINGVTDH